MWHMPVLIILGIYMPAALIGVYLFEDSYANSFLVMLTIFTTIYYAIFALLRRINLPHKHRLLGADKTTLWKVLAFLSIVLYLLALTVAVATTEITPLVAALKGGGVFDISWARGMLFARREGYEAFLRYGALILGRAVMPFIALCLYQQQHALRHFFLIGLLACYSISLEKASAIFVFLPLIIFFSSKRQWRAVVLCVSALILCIGLWTGLAGGALHDPMVSVSPVAKNINTDANLLTNIPEKNFSIGRHGDPRRHYLLNYTPIPNMLNISPDGKTVMARSIFILNRMVWIPYITAYDWLKFQDEILNGKLTMGRSITGLSWLFKEPKLQLEQMVYEYEFGPPPAGAGASNTIFFVDAKLAFGWTGAVIYCVLFAVFSAIVFSAKNEIIKIASMTSFFTAALSPLTATLLSGGLLIFIFLALFFPGPTSSTSSY